MRPRQISVAPEQLHGAAFAVHRIADGCFEDVWADFRCIYVRYRTEEARFKK